MLLSYGSSARDCHAALAMTEGRTRNDRGERAGNDGRK